MRPRTLGFLLAFCSLLICPKADAWDLFGNPAPAAVSPTQVNIQSAMSAAVNPKNQAVASKVFCYCGCDKEHGHKNLLDCYKQGHLPSCHMCQSEFVKVGQMDAQGASVAQVQSEIDREFSPQYPYPQKSPILQRYLSTRESVTHM